MIRLSDIHKIVHTIAGPVTNVVINDVHQQISKDCQNISRSISGASVLVNFDKQLASASFSLDYDIIIDFSNTLKEASNYNALACNFKLSADKLEWLQTGNLGDTTYTNHLRPDTEGKWSKFKTKMALQLSIGKLANIKRLTVLSNTPLHFNRIQDKINIKSFVLTFHETKTCLINLTSNQKASHVLTFTSPQKSLRIINGSKTLARKSDGEVTTPNITLLKDKSVTISPFINNQTAPNKMPKALAKAILTYSNKTIETNQLKWLPYFTNFKNNLKIAEQRNVFPEEVRKLENLFNSLNESMSICTSTIHGDLTPWNAKIHNQKVTLENFDFTQHQGPILFDMFHYVFQSASLLNNNDYNKIKQNLTEAFAEPQVANFISKYKINIELNFKLYLLGVISFQLAKIASSDDTQKINEALLTNWNAALNDLYQPLNTETCRKTFITHFHQRLQHTTHAFLSLDSESPELIGEATALGIAVIKDDIPAMESFIHANEMTLNYKRIQKSHLSTFEIHFKDGSFLCLDLIHRCIKDRMEYFNLKPLLLNCQKNSLKTMVPNLMHDFEFSFLYHQLNEQNFPQRYKDFFSRKFAGNYSTRENTLKNIQRKYNISVRNISELYPANFNFKKSIQQAINKDSRTSFKDFIVRGVTHLRDLVIELNSRRGFAISLSGLSGVGKTTIINNLKSKLESNFRKQVVVLEQRPRILPVLSSYKHGKKLIKTIYTLLPGNPKNLAK